MQFYQHQVVSCHSVDSVEAVVGGGGLASFIQAFDKNKISTNYQKIQKDKF